MSLLFLVSGGSPLSLALVCLQSHQWPAESHIACESDKQCLFCLLKFSTFKDPWDFPGGPVVKILQAMSHGQKKERILFFCPWQKNESANELVTLPLACVVPVLSPTGVAWEHAW